MIVRKIVILLLAFSLISAMGWVQPQIAAQGLALSGDLNGDGKVNVGDVAMLYSYVLGNKQLEGISSMDITGDGKVNIADVSRIYTKVRWEQPNQALLNYAKKISEVQTPNTLTLSVMSDTHYCSHQPVPQTKKLETATAMAELSKYINVDGIVNLGDFVAGNEEKEKTLEDLEQLLNCTNKNSDCPVFYVRGNHDDNGWYSRAEDGNPGTAMPHEIIDHTQWYEAAFGTTAKYVVTDPQNPMGGYGYFDHEASKIRIFLLNTSDIPYVLEEDGTYRYNAYECNAFGNDQLNFVARSLQFADKETPNDWAAMFLAHVPIDTTVTDGYRFGAANMPIRGYIQMLSIIAAYHKGISYAYYGSINSTGTDQVTGELLERPEDFRVAVKVDYSAKGCGDVISFVNGHTHIDNASRKVGLDYSLSYGYTYLSMVGAESFSTMVVDREKNQVSVFKYGEGRGPSQSKDPQIVKGGKVLVANGEKEFGINFAKDGQWTIPFAQIRPQGESLLQGADVVAMDGVTVPDDTGAFKLEADTLLPDVLLEDSGYAISNPVLLKQNTKYLIPDIGNSKVYTFHHSLLKCRGVYQPTKFGDQRIITGGQNNGFYMMVVFDKESYPDYENFYIKEWVHEDVPPNTQLPPIYDEPLLPPEEDPPRVPIEGNLFNGMSELWGDGYLVNTAANLDVETLELSSATENAKYVISKAMEVQANTTYEIPDDVANSLVIYSYTYAGTYNGTCVQTDGDGVKTFTGKSSGGYVVFCFNRNVYWDFEGFYVKKVETNPPEEENKPAEPIEGNLFNGMSELWGNGYIVNTSANLDVKTLELSSATENAKYVISKAMEVQANTTYEIPDDVANSLVIYSYTYAGTYNGTCTQTAGDGVKTFIGKSSGGYVVFCFNRNIYWDFEGFYVKKVENDPPEEENKPAKPIEGNLFNGMSELWGDGYLVNTSAKLNVETLELSAAVQNQKYAISKAIPIKAGTEYRISACGSAIAYSFSADGTYNGTIVLNSGDGYKTFTCTGNRAYVVFCFHKSSYPDYRNFYILEHNT